MLKKIFIGVFLTLFLLMNSSSFVFAESVTEKAGGTILPGADKAGEYSTIKKCNKVMLKPETDLQKNIKDEWDTAGKGVLACGIKTGQIRLWMVPYYIRYILELVIQISGLACVAATVYGGFLYLFAGISEDKDKGKKAITYGVIGMVITFLAWAIVNIFIILLTGA